MNPRFPAYETSEDNQTPLLRGAKSWVRTSDAQIFNLPLYQLSYLGIGIGIGAKSENRTPFTLHLVPVAGIEPATSAL